MVLQKSKRILELFFKNKKAMSPGRMPIKMGGGGGGAAKIGGGGAKGGAGGG